MNPFWRTWLIGPFCFICVAGILAQATAPSDKEIAQWVRAAASYESGQSMEALRKLEELARQSSDNEPLRKELEAGLVQLLVSDSTLEAKQFACQQLATIGTENSLPALGELLADEATATMASRALSTHPSPNASAVLRSALPNLRGPARIQVVSTLGDRQDSASVPLMTELAKDPDSATATAAIFALGKIANEPAREAIASLSREMGQGSSPELARAVFEASMNAAERLAAIGERDAAMRIYRELLAPAHPASVRRGAFEALLQLDEDGGEQRIVDTLRGSDTLLKPVAIAGMRPLRSAAATERFAAALPQLPPQEQVWLIEALAARRDDAARAAVQGSLVSAEPTVRLAAIQALGKAADADTVSLLSKVLTGNPTSKERAAIERALMSLPQDAALDGALVDELQRTSAPATAQASLIRVLARREVRAAFQPMVRCAEQPETAELAFQALASLSTAEDVPMLLGRLIHLQVPAARSDAEAAAAQALLKTKDDARRAGAVLDALSNTTDIETRCSLLRLLPVCAGPQALTALIAAQGDSNAQVRDTAIRAVVEWPDARAWDPLVKILRNTSHLSHRILALNALVRLAEEGNSRADEEAVERYRTLLERAHTDEDRKLILGALAGAAHPGALKLALPLVLNPGVRAEAQLAARKIAESVQKEHPKAAADAMLQLNISD